MSLTDEKQIITLLKFLAISFVVGVVLITIYYHNQTKGYAYVQKGDSFAGKVTATKRLRGDTRVHLESGEMLVLPYADNYNYQRYRLSEFVKEGDLLLKKKGSDTLVIKRYENEYIFVMDRVINEKQ
ncbi:MAG: hypothetical protein KF845_14260 [Cyclobacteriaceae bacterium]|nr:hypothetical protein [Cyclobacteriaceae bacterium]